jgi:protocatechuate 3,4-dioxygenase alpha subunit
MERLRQTPSQTIGPFFAYGLTARQYGYDYNSIVSGLLITENMPGDRIQISGKVFDGKGESISDAMLECWQADEKGQYKRLIDLPHEGFIGLGRLGTGSEPDLSFRFVTVKPMSIGKGHAPHINIILFMRGSLRHLYSRIYFSDEQAANQSDELLNAVPEERRNTLIARLCHQDGRKEYIFDIHMQGNLETVFFEI